MWNSEWFSYKLTQKQMVLVALLGVSLTSCGSGDLTSQRSDGDIALALFDQQSGSGTAFTWDRTRITNSVVIGRELEELYFQPIFNQQTGETVFEGNRNQGGSLFSVASDWKTVRSQTREGGISLLNCTSANGEPLWQSRLLNPDGPHILPMSAVSIDDRRGISFGSGMTLSPDATRVGDKIWLTGSRNGEYSIFTLDHPERQVQLILGVAQGRGVRVLADTHVGVLVSSFPLRDTKQDGRSEPPQIFVFSPGSSRHKVLAAQTAKAGYFSRAFEHNSQVYVLHTETGQGSQSNQLYRLGESSEALIEYGKAFDFWFNGNPVVVGTVAYLFNSTMGNQIWGLEYDLALGQVKSEFSFSYGGKLDVVEFKKKHSGRI